MIHVQYHSNYPCNLWIGSLTLPYLHDMCDPDPTLVPGPDPRAQMLDQVLQVLMVCAQGHTFMLVPDPI